MTLVVFVGQNRKTTTPFKSKVSKQAKITVNLLVSEFLCNQDLVTRWLMLYEDNELMLRTSPHAHL